jgi:LuxR family maltose regulon positive regulatory protein
MTVPLLQTKLYIPPVRPELVSRPHLIERLDEGLDLGHRLTLVSAPAGFGKTTLLSEWVRGLGTRRAPPPRVAWLSLDEGDNDPARFLAYLVAALQTAGQNVGDELAGALQSPQPPPLEGVLARLINQVNAISASFVLVLDDYHLVTAQPIHDAIAFLLDHSPDNVHLAIATRADPPLPVARLRGRGQLTELRLPDLRFAPQEAAEFLNRVMGLELTAADVAALESRTEGWIAGLQMAAVALRAAVPMQGDAASFVQDFTGDNRFILDYLIEEVLQHQPDRVQTFLLQTSILDRLCGPLCDAVLGISESANKVRKAADQPAGDLPIRRPDDLSGQEMLAYLERANLFVVPLDNRREWYRYHRLFADLLRSRLQRAHPDLVPVLHRRASTWHEQSGLVSGAIDHALAAGALERAADLVEQNSEATLMRGQAATFLRWVDALPDELVRARPTLCVFHAWMLMLYGRPLKVVESRLQDAERGGELVAGRVTALRGLMAAFRGQVSPAAELSRRALEQLPEEEQFVRAFATWILRTSELVAGEGPVDIQVLDDVLRMSQQTGNVMVAVMIVSNQAELAMRQGQLHRAAAIYRKALDLATDAWGQRLPIAGQALIGLGELSREWGDLDAAARYLVEGIRLTERWTEVGPFDAYIALARVRRAQGDVDSAWEAIRKAQELALKSELTELDDLSVALSEAWMRVTEGDLEPARRWAEERDLFKYIASPLREEAGDTYDHRTRKYELLVLARLLIALERPDEALTLLASLVPIAEWRGRPGMLIEIHVLEALAHHALGHTDQAMAALEHAFSLAEPKGYVRIFADEGEPVIGLLQEAARRGIAVEYAGKLLAAFGLQTKDEERKTEPSPSTADTGRPSLLEPLSARELEVLRLLNTHLSSTEIAEQLCISVNTARSHIKNIYGKLNVHRRSDAVQRAVELGLL